MPRRRRTSDALNRPRGSPPRLARAAVLGCLLAACTGGGRAPPGLTIAAVRQPATSLFFVAEAGGCFERERLSVRSELFSLGRDALQPLLRGEVDVAIAFETPVLRAAFSDGRIRALTRIHRSTTNTRLLAARQSGVRSFADLAGKRIGAARGTNADFFVDLVLRFGGVPPGRVEIVDLSPQDSVRALASGRIDAAVLSDLAAAEAERTLGDAAVVLHTEIYEEVSLLVTRTDVLERRWASLRALVSALACAERLAAERDDRGLELIRGRFPEQDPAVLHDELKRVTWALGIDNVMLDLLRQERDWLLGSGGSGALRGAPPDPERLFTAGILEEVVPEAVTFLPAREFVRW